MQTLFSNVLTAGFHGSIIIAAALVLRLILKRAPKKYICVLWLMAFARLLMPFEIRSELSLQPEAVQISPSVRAQIPQEPIQYDLPEPVPAVPEDAALPPDTGVVYGDAFTPPESIPEGLEGYYPSPEEQAGEPLVINWNGILLSAWLTVSAALAGYGLLSCGKLKRRVREAVRSTDGAWECGGLETAFVLGWLRPRIYIPMGLPENDRRYILAHERVHMRRGDHWCKLLAYLALVIHWFNPFVWAAYALLCRDMEMACDEQVVKDMGVEERKAYSKALLTCSANHRSLAACPVAFGETDVKGRIQNVLNYRKPAFWLSVIAVAAVVFVAVCLLTSPAEQENMEAVPETTETAPALEETGPEPAEAAQLVNPYEDYEYRYEGRDREWEEDILYLAEAFLEEHRKLSDKYYFAYHVYEVNLAGYLVNDNAFFDAELRSEFIREVDQLLAAVPELTDVQIQYELRRIVDLLEDASSKVVVSGWEFFPIAVEEMEGSNGLDYYTVRIPNAYQDVSYSRLTAINGIPLEQVIDRLRPYFPSENRYLENVGICLSYWNSLLVRKEALQAAGVLDWDADQADFTFALADGTIKTVTLTAITSEEYDKDNMTRVDFGAKRLYLYANSDQYYWYEARPESKSFYVRISYCNESQQPFSSFTQALLEDLGSSGSCEKLIIDLRGNAGGSYPMSGMDDFYDALSRLENVDISVLIDGGTAGGGLSIAVRIRDTVPGSVLVGTPAGQPMNVLANCRKYTTKHNGLVFYISLQYWMNAPQNDGDTVQPDIPVYQSLEDHKLRIDTVLQAALELETETARGLSKEDMEAQLQELKDKLTQIQASLCMIPGCTDAAHDHSARDCTAEGCTDPAHGHRHHEH